MHKILEDKREVLLKRLDELIREAARTREEMSNDLLQAYEALFDAYMTIGPKTIEAIASVTPPRVDVTVDVLNMVNVVVPRLSVKVKGTEMTYGFGDTSSSLDRATQMMMRALPSILKAAEVENAIFALAADLKKTQRLINGLEYVIIPKHEDSIKFISSTLAEREREDFVRLKHLKAIMEQAKEAGTR